MTDVKDKVDTLTIMRDKLRLAAQESGMTQEEIGLGMGFSKASARQAVSRLLNADSEHDPRLSTLLSFAKAIGKPLRKLL
jgi:transcriptional regulator with XRE-family HTH domain